MTKKEILFKYLQVFPLALALPRASECLAFREAVIKAPSLDLGCGDGVFSRICFPYQISVGLDSDSAEVQRAQKSQAYKKAVIARADKMPFADGYFRTVLANSSLEHVSEITATLKEINRVLRKGGRLIITVPRPVISDCLFFSQVLKRLGAKRLAQAYVDLKQRLWRHYNLWEVAVWQRKLAHAGFRVGKSLTLIPGGVVALHDLFYPWGLPYALDKKFFGGKLFFRPKWLAKILTALLINFCQIFTDKQGTTQYLEAIKN